MFTSTQNMTFICCLTHGKYEEDEETHEDSGLLTHIISLIIRISFSVTAFCFSLSVLGDSSCVRFGTAAMLSLRSLALLAFTCLLAFVASPRVVAGQDVVYTTYQTMAARLRSQPFDPAVRDQIVDSMKKAMSLYTFLNINRDSTQGAPTDISVWEIKSDILADIQAVAEATYSSAIEMDEAFANIFMKVNDAHTSYRKNYAAFAFGLPFRMSSQAAVDAKNNVFTQVSIFSTKTSFKLYQTVYGYSPLVNATVSTTGAPAALDDIENYVIVSIQGQPAVKYLWSLANQQGNFEVGTSKDPHTRYNLLTHGFTVDPNGAPGQRHIRHR